ncbi:hypothetical protein EVJ58_g6651 [Rhodofomes roseus]|uniref:Endonuclease/exonuclease/phosphatase domain-containing protein n=1 Tax=Rhodofomes roseus TaxID=34475 RepID=A0A4Y9YB26_9APHY|nr:hypothetical protein EVJ58_g6651 [Rhodofomes roseus]
MSGVSSRIMSSERSEVSQEAQTLALAEQRRLKKEQRQAALEKEAEERSRILPREWAVVQDAPGIGWHTRVMTWNLLAQTLVRRELFPKSDCLKAAQRENMIYREILSHNADICCMQGRHSSIVLRTQAAILLREVSRFRDELSPAESPWPCIIAGDDAAYSLLTGDPLSPEQEARLAASRVVHKSIDPNVPVAPEAATEGAEEDEGAAATESDPDKVITNARPALPADGLLTDAELADMLRQYDRPTSVYDEGQRICTAASTLERELTFGNRAPIPAERHGAYEPNWTSYTHYWKSVLDYMFVLSPPQRNVIVTRLAKPHRTEALSPGIPLKGVCGSDHISLGAELCLPPPS